MPSPARDAVCDNFKQHLFAGTLKQGSFVTQRELCDLLNSPVGTVREALQRLEAENLVNVQPQRGVWIANTSLRMINESFQFRMMIEVEAVRRFARSPDVNALGHLLEQTREIQSQAGGAMDVDGDAVIKAGSEVDFALHDLLIERMDNSLIHQTYRTLKDRQRLIRLNGTYTPRRLEKAMGEHIAVIEALLAGDADQSEQALREHLSISWRRSLGADEVGL